MVANPHYKRKCSAAKNADHTLKRIKGRFSTESVLFSLKSIVHTKADC